MSLKRQVRSYLFRGEMKNYTPLWRELHFEVKMLKNCHSRSTFWSCILEEWHAVVAWSTFWSHNAKTLSLSEHRLHAHSKNNTPLWREAHFKVAGSKKGTRLWGEAHLQVQMRKKLTLSQHFLMFRSRKFVRRCSEKHICKEQCAKQRRFAAHLEVLMPQT